MKKPKIELYSDVLEEEPANDATEKEHQKFDKRLHKSAGWTEPSFEYKCDCDEKGKTWEGAQVKEELRWD